MSRSIWYLLGCDHSIPQSELRSTRVRPLCLLPALTSRSTPACFGSITRVLLWLLFFNFYPEFIVLFLLLFFRVIFRGHPLRLDPVQTYILHPFQRINQFDICQLFRKFPYISVMSLDRNYVIHSRLSTILPLVLLPSKSLNLVKPHPYPTYITKVYTRASGSWLFSRREAPRAKFVLTFQLSQAPILS